MMFSDEEIRAIICSRGGYGSLRVSDVLDYSLISRNPKIFVGYSDITVLHMSILKMTGLVTFHGPMLVSLEKEVQFTHRNLFDVLSGKAPILTEFPPDHRPSILRGGSGEGELLGGNLSLLTNMLGTAWDFDPAGKILFVEDIDEKLYRVDRLLLHLRRAGKLKDIAGLIVGEMVEITDEEIPFGKTVDEIVMDVCEGTEFPIAANFPCGHGANQMTLPLSVKARLDCTGKVPEFTFLEPAVV